MATPSLTAVEQINLYITSLHSFTPSGDDILRSIEESSSLSPALTLEEYALLKHFNTHYHRAEGGTFMIPLPKKSDNQSLGESRSQAVRRFFSLECSLIQKNKLREFQDVMQEYLDLGHAESVPSQDMDKSPSDVF